MTTTWTHVGHHRHGSQWATADTAERTSGQTRSIGLGMVGAVAFLVSAWGGIAPYVGPAFGFSADGAPAWHWSLSHAVLALIPGALGCLVGISLMAPHVTTVGRRRVGLTAAGVVAIACGAWFVIGPLAWPVLVDTGSYFTGASALRELEYQIAYSLGPGLVLAMCGAYALGWATRHNLPLEAAGGPAAMAGPAPVAAEPAMAAPPVSPVSRG